jgi:hypothetical protein
VTCRFDKDLSILIFRFILGYTMKIKNHHTEIENFR